MKTELTGKSEDCFIFSLELTQEEIEQLSYADMGKLLTDIKRLSGPDRKKEVPSVTYVKKPAPFTAKHYKNIELDGVGAEVTEDERYEKLLEYIIDHNEFQLPDELEDEIEFVYKGLLQHVKYQNVFGMSEEETGITEPEELMKQAEASVVGEYKENLILKSIIEQEGLDCTFEELEAEAQAMAERDDCTLEFVRQFMGNDYGFLKGDLLKKKAKQLILNTDKSRTIDIKRKTIG